MEPATAWGASPGDWSHFAERLQLLEDLLPVVSNPGAAVSPGSKLKEPGKVPSVYNGQHQVAGLPGWTQRHTTEGNVRVWSAQPDYGICVQTRVVRAIDIDVTDAAQAQAIHQAVDEWLLERLPVRQRANSPKRLLAVRCAGDIPKRKFTTEHGIVELLATGQQFIAVGTHPSGVRYEWAAGLPGEIPAIDRELLDGLWAHLVERFATAAPTERAAREQLVPRVASDEPDPVADFLHERGLVAGADAQGRLFVECPWKDQHSGDSGPSETSWLTAGTGGHGAGAFRCMHAHCEARTTAEFLTAVGYYSADDFEVIAQPPAAAAAAWPKLTRDKQGRIEATINNVIAAVEHGGMWGGRLVYDEFQDETMLHLDGWGNPDEWRALSDGLVVDMRAELEQRGFKPIGRELMRDAIASVALRHTRDSLHGWLEGLRWDGVPRIERFFVERFGAVDTPYVRAVGRYVFTALAARAVAPGCKVDMAPVLTGPQGIGKSSGIAALAPWPDAFAEIDLAERDDDQSRKLRGTCVVELPELRGLNSRDLEAIKAWVSKIWEGWIPKYKEFETRFPRRCVMFGTTNEDEFLNDATGERRWLPVRVSKVDVAAIERERDQLWAEGHALWMAEGIAWEEAERLALAEHAEFKVRDPWGEHVRRWLASVDDDLDGTQERRDARPFLAVDVLVGALGFERRQVGKREEMRIGKVLQALGYQRARMQIGGTQHWRWSRG